MEFNISTNSQYISKKRKKEIQQDQSINIDNHDINNSNQETPVRKIKKVKKKKIPLVDRINNDNDIKNNNGGNGKDDIDEVFEGEEKETVKKLKTKDDRQFSDEDAEVDYNEFEKKMNEKIEIEEIEFDVRVIEEIDFQAIRRFMIHYCQGQTFDSSEFVEILLSQGEIGSVLRQIDTIETFGFISIVNIYMHREKSCIRQIKKFVLSCLSEGEQKQWENELELPKLGLFLNDRIINVPHIMAPQFNESFFEEINNAKESGLPYDFDNYLYIARFQQKKKSPKIEFEKIEDDIYYKHSRTKVVIKLPTKEEGFAIMIFAAHKIPTILKQISETVMEGYSW